MLIKGNHAENVSLSSHLSHSTCVFVFYLLQRPGLLISKESAHQGENLSGQEWGSHHSHNQEGVCKPESGSIHFQEEERKGQQSPIFL